jgi:hypothetical protein
VSLEANFMDLLSPVAIFAQNDDDDYQKFEMSVFPARK